MNILITAPSLNESENVSGISTIVRTILDNNQTSARFFHFKIGTKDGVGKGLSWASDQLRLLPRMAKFIRQHQIGVIHLNTDFTKASLIRDFIIFSFLRSVMKKPILLHVHGGYMLMRPPKKGSLFQVIIARMLKGSDVNVVLSKVEQEQLRVNFNAQSQVLPNAVAPLATREVNKDFSGKIKLIFLGRIVKAKGIYLIVEALKQLGEFHHDLIFNLYGSGAELTEVLQQLKAINTLEFTYNGVVKGAEKWKALKDAHIFLLPSIYGEGLPIAMLEAMQSGCIPVVSDDASITTVVKNTVNGFVVKKGSQQELTATLIKILKERDNFEVISSAARTTISDNYGILQYMENLESYYSQIACYNKVTA